MALSVFAAAEDAPDQPAIITGDKTLSYRQLADRVLLRTRRLLENGTAGSDPVAVVARNDLPTVEMLHALIALGTPVMLLHPKLTQEERAGLVEAAEVSGVVEPSRDRVRDRPAPAPPPPDERAMAIIHTSGTSGHMKGVVLSRRAFVASAAASAANMGWRDRDRWLLTLPVAHVGGFSILVRCLLARRPVVLAKDTGPHTLVETMRRHDITLVSLVPTLLKRVLDLDPPVERPERLRAVLLGGAAASPALLARAADSGWPVLTTYGMSEACSQVTTQRYGTVNRGEAGSGPPLPGVELRIADDDAILVRGPTLFSGYLPADDNPFLPDGWFATGDHGRLDDQGNLHVLGRRTDRIVTGAENVDPIEVERVLEGLPGVQQACVFGQPDEEWGEVVCAALVLGVGPTDVTWTRVRAAVRTLRDQIAPFKLPRRIAVVDAIPKNATGKVDRRAAASAAKGKLRVV